MSRWLPRLCALAWVLVLLASGVSVAQEKDRRMEREPAGEEMDLARDCGAMVVCGFRGLAPGDPGVEAILADIAAGRVSGVVLFDKDVAAKSGTRNVASPEQLKALTAYLAEAVPEYGHRRLPLLVSVDMEGGAVARLSPRHGFPAFPSAAELGRGNPATTLATARAMGALLADLGLNLDFAPVADVNLNPASPAIGALGRSFGDDPQAVRRHAAAFVRGLQEEGVLACMKHFPGHGSARGDTHAGFVDVTETWSEAELVPYGRSADSDHGRLDCPDLVMTAHVFNANWDPELPASLAPKVYQMLGQRLERSSPRGCQSVRITDDLQMRAITDRHSLRETVRLAVNAGADLLLFGNNLVYEPELPTKVQALLMDLVKKGEVARERVHEAAVRVRRMRDGLTVGMPSTGRLPKEALGCAPPGSRLSETRY